MVDGANPRVELGSYCSPAWPVRASSPVLATKAMPDKSSRPRRARGVTIVRPRRKDEPGKGPHLAPIRQRVESIYWTAKDILTLERHGARTLDGLKVRLASRFVALAAAISLNHELGLPPRAPVQYVA